MHFAKVAGWSPQLGCGERVAHLHLQKHVTADAKDDCSNYVVQLSAVEGKALQLNTPPEGKRLTGPINTGRCLHTLEISDEMPKALQILL